MALLAVVSRGTFGHHLTAVRHLIPSRCAAIAEKLNDARNDLLHWTPDRFSGSRYDGLDVSAEAGFQACMNDALQFIQTVPLNMNRRTRSPSPRRFAGRAPRA